MRNFMDIIKLTESVLPQDDFGDETSPEGEVSPLEDEASGDDATPIKESADEECTDAECDDEETDDALELSEAYSAFIGSDDFLAENVLGDIKKKTP